MTKEFEKFGGLGRLKLDIDETRFEVPKFEPPKVNLPDVEKMMAPVRRAQQEKLEREKKTIELLEGLLELSETRPDAIQHIQTLIQNSGTIENMQNVYSSNNVNQIITHNSGMSAEEFVHLISTMREISSLLKEDISIEVNEVITQLEEEVAKEDRKPGVIKASLSYLKSLFSEIVVDPAKSLAKAQFGEYAKEKLPHIIDGIGHIFKSLG